MAVCIVAGLAPRIGGDAPAATRAAAPAPTASAASAPASDSASDSASNQEATATAERDRAAEAAGRSSRSTRPTGPQVARPVAGLTQVQMNNAHAIVATGLRHRVPRRALVVAVATALQESTLLNRASEVLPESKRYRHQGTGSDHDSVGLFQQRASTGWGKVADLMRPEYAAAKFYGALLRVPGWQRMPLTLAAQAVQASAYPDAYAKHERRAATIVAALLA